jgi:RNA polymerase sigma factor (sigma-70 family)
MQLTEEQKQMVEDNIKLVYFVINKHWQGQPQDIKNELFQEGCIALINAVKRYDGNVGKFSTFAVRSIYLYITRQFNLVLASQFKVNNDNYKEAYENSKVLRLNSPSKYDESMLMYETIEDKHNDIDEFVHKYGTRQQARYMLKFMSDDDYDFMLNYSNQGYNGKFNKQKWSKDYSRYTKLLRLARIYNKKYLSESYKY